MHPPLKFAKRLFFVDSVTAQIHWAVMFEFCSTATYIGPLSQPTARFKLAAL